MAKIINVKPALEVEKKLPDVRIGKNSTIKYKKKGKTLVSKFKLNWNNLFFFIKSLYNNKNTKDKIIPTPIRPKSTRISK